MSGSMITVKRNKKNKTVSKTIPPVSPPKQASKRPVWLEKLSKKNVPRLRAKKMTRTVQIRSSNEGKDEKSALPSLEELLREQGHIHLNVGAEKACDD